MSNQVLGALAAERTLAIRSLTQIDFEAIAGNQYFVDCMNIPKVVASGWSSS
ncbi:MAG: hypothetical protein U0S12_06710 [Fimbriimonadales bacterium]